jgi:hypothetical protein
VRLDDLDARVVPRVAARLRALLDGAAQRRAAARETVQAATTTVMAPGPDNPLRRLDARYAGSGPLALLRDVPQLGLLLIAALVVAGAGVALERSGSPRRTTQSAEQLAAVTPTVLGPAPGTKVATYLAAVKKRAAAVSQAAPDGMFTALVSFDSYRTPKEAQALLGDLQVKRVLAHVQAVNAEVLPIPVTTALVADVDPALTAIAQRKLKDQKEFAALAATIAGTTREEKQFKAFYVQAAATAGKEAKIYKAGCRCLFAALVRGKARDLASLPALAGVRAVDIGGGSEDTLQVQPLLPEQTVTVTRPITPPSGNGA